MSTLKDVPHIYALKKQWEQSPEEFEHLRLGQYIYNQTNFEYGSSYHERDIRKIIDLLTVGLQGKMIVCDAFPEGFTVPFNSIIHTSTLQYMHMYTFVLESGFVNVHVNLTDFDYCSVDRHNPRLNKNSEVIGDLFRNWADIENLLPLIAKRNMPAWESITPKAKIPLNEPVHAGFKYLKYFLENHKS